LRIPKSCVTALVIRRPPAQVRVPSQCSPYIKLHWAGSIFSECLRITLPTADPPLLHIHTYIILVKQAILGKQHEGTLSDLVQQTLSDLVQQPLKTYLFRGKDPHALYVPLY